MLGCSPQSPWFTSAQDLNNWFDAYFKGALVEFKGMLVLGEPGLGNGGEDILFGLMTLPIGGEGFALTGGRAVAGRAVGAGAKVWGGRAAAGAVTQGVKVFGRDVLQGGFRNVAVLQKGGRKITSSTARALNQNLSEEVGRDLTKREWGSALERLKKEELLPPDHHGWIHDNGDYTNSNGDILGNLLDYVP